MTAAAGQQPEPVARPAKVMPDQPHWRGADQRQHACRAPACAERSDRAGRIKAPRPRPHPTSNAARQAGLRDREVPRPHDVLDPGRHAVEHPQPDERTPPASRPKVALVRRRQLQAVAAPALARLCRPRAGRAGWPLSGRRRREHRPLPTTAATPYTHQHARRMPRPGSPGRGSAPSPVDAARRTWPVSRALKRTECTRSSTGDQRAATVVMALSTNGLPNGDRRSARSAPVV